jgi:diadenosine tetraphosphatase ApaH/serine/threonine PP2A family protein phosphatase
VRHRSAAAASQMPTATAIAQNLAVRVAVISDVHANLYALEAVLGEIDREPPDAIWCLGDTVGYGPRPNECCELVRERADLILVGNHDLLALGSAEVDVAEFNPEAAEASLWTAKQLSGESRTFLEALEPTAERDGVQLFHGSPRDPVWEYVLTEVAALDALARTEAPLVLVGHTHVATALRLEDGRLEGGVAPADFEAGLDSGRWLLNPGSVGQPRDANADAAFLELDLAAKRARFRRVAYPVERTQEEIRERGLPDSLAERLAHGV